MAWCLFKHRNSFHLSKGFSEWYTTLGNIDFWGFVCCLKIFWKNTFWKLDVSIIRWSAKAPTQLGTLRSVVKCTTFRGTFLTIHPRMEISGFQNVVPYRLLNNGECPKSQYTKMLPLLYLQQNSELNFKFLYHIPVLNIFCNMGPWEYRKTKRLDCFIVCRSFILING